MSSVHPGTGRWTVGADAVHRGTRADGDCLPDGRLHAVGGAGLVEGRALCLAPVTLLDPVRWTWPDDADEDRPLCWICLALTHQSEPDVPCDCCPPR